MRRKTRKRRETGPSILFLVFVLFFLFPCLFLFAGHPFHPFPYCSCRGWSRRCKAPAPPQVNRGPSGASRPLPGLGNSGDRAGDGSGDGAAGTGAGGGLG